MYRRYSQVEGADMPLTQVKKNRIKNIVIAALIVAVAVMCAIGIPALSSKSGARSLDIRRMQAECDEAIRLTSTLSRTGGTDSAGILARIRCNVYSIGVINDLSSGQDGKEQKLLSEEELTTLQTMIDGYLSFLTYGMDTGEYQTNLQNALGALQATVNALE